MSISRPARGVKRSIWWASPDWARTGCGHERTPRPDVNRRDRAEGGILIPGAPGGGARAESEREGLGSSLGTGGAHGRASQAPGGRLRQKRLEPLRSIRLGMFEPDQGIKGGRGG